MITQAEDSVLRRTPWGWLLLGMVAKAKGAAIKLEKVEELQKIMGFGVMSNPGVVIDGKVVHAGGVPTRTKVEGWFA